MAAVGCGFESSRFGGFEVWVVSSIYRDGSSWCSWCGYARKYPWEGTGCQLNTARMGRTCPTVMVCLVAPGQTYPFPGESWHRIPSIASPNPRLWVNSVPLGKNHCPIFDKMLKTKILGRNHVGVKFGHNTRLLQLGPAWQYGATLAWSTTATRGMTSWWTKG